MNQICGPVKVSNDKITLLLFFCCCCQLSFIWRDSLMRGFDLYYKTQLFKLLKYFKQSIQRSKKYIYSTHVYSLTMDVLIYMYTNGMNKYA